MPAPGTSVMIPEIIKIVIGAIKVAFGIVLGIVCIVSVPREVFQKEYWVERKIAKQQKNGKRDPVNLPGERHR